MKRLEQRITCEDAEGLNYLVDIFVNVDANGRLGLRECWLVSGAHHQPVDIIEPMTEFWLVNDEITIRRIGAD